MVTTALALSSVKSRPSLTFPRHTAISRAPSAAKNRTKVRFTVISFQGQRPACRVGLTSFCAAFDCLVVGLKQLVKVPFPAATRLGDHRFLLLQLLPQTRVAPAISQFVQHLTGPQWERCKRSEITQEATIWCVVLTAVKAFRLVPMVAQT